MYGSTPGAIAAAQAALDIPAVLASARGTYGSSFAGWWIDNCGSSPTLNIMVAGNTSAKAESLFRSRLAPRAASATILHHGKYSLAQLAGFVSDIQQYAASNFTSAANSPSTPWIVTVDPEDNAVSITLPHADAKLLAQVQSVVPTDALRVQWNDSPAPSASLVAPAQHLRPEAVSSQHGPGWEMGATRNTYPPYKGGLSIFTGPPNHAQCTSGFTLEAAGTYYGVTAGHCADEGDQVDLDQNVADLIGTVVAHSLGTGGDYSVFKLYKQASSDWKGQIIAESNSVSGFVDNVIGRQSDANQGVGLEVCSSGTTTNKVACGTVTTEFKTIIIKSLLSKGVPVSNLMCATYAGAKGDSGGPVYVPYPGNEGTAAGINSLSYLGETCYTTIDSVLQGITNQVAHGKNAYVVDYNGHLS